MLQLLRYAMFGAFVTVALVIASATGDEDASVPAAKAADASSALQTHR